MSKEPIKINFIIKLGLWKADKANELALRMNLIYQKIKADTGETLNIDYHKRPWTATLNVNVEGYPETIRRFVNELRTTTETMGLKVSPENWWKI